MTKHHRAPTPIDERTYRRAADRFARRLGGCGHPYAAGTRLASPLATVVRRGVREAARALVGAASDLSAPEIQEDRARMLDGVVPGEIN